MRKILLILSLFVSLGIVAAERTILIGPKTIGRGWKDNIVLEARHFQNAKAGDVVTVYNDNARSNAQGAFQNPETWQGISEAYNYFGIEGPFRLTITEEMLPILKSKGLGIGGHDYRIVQVTLTPGEEFKETIVWKGPSVQMADNWSANAQISGTCFKTLKQGDAIRFHVSNVKPGAAIKLSDLTWNPLDNSVNGASLSGDAFTYYINDNAPLIKLSIGGFSSNPAMMVSGKGYKLDKIGLVQFIGQIDEDYSQAQHAPKEYILKENEIFHGEKEFGMDWRGNLSISAAKFQDATENDVVVISYTILSECQQKGETPRLSIRENGGDWPDLSPNPDIKSGDHDWQMLDGNDYVLAFDEASLDKVRTTGFIITGMGFVLNKVEIMKAE